MRLLFLIPLFLFGCASNKEVYELREEKLVIVDTIVIPGHHIHHPDKNMCIYFEEMRLVVEDTLYLEFYEAKK